MRHLHAAAATDRGRVRPRNEDAYVIGASVFAVADGMGGHLAGDVASATALLPIEGLDGKNYDDANGAQAALLDAILAANAAVVRKAADEPNLRGMGTTLTATIVEGPRLHVGHVGDSRAYLVRHGAITQLTRDHTLVAHLIEEGRITREQAASHPHRSIVTRAIGVDIDIEVDTLTIDLHPGDQVLLCSDGLTGPVADHEILEIVNSERDADQAVRDLVAVANEHGGPDNITAVLLRYHGEEGPPDDSHGDGPAPHATAPLPPVSSWRDGLSQLASSPGTTNGAGGPAPRRMSRAAIAVAAVAAVLLLAALVTFLLLSRSFFIGVDGEQVVIYRGVPADLGPLPLSWVAEATDVELREVAPWYVERLESGVAARSLGDARRVVDVIPRRGASPRT